MLAHATSADETLSIVMAFSGLWIGWAGRMARPLASACLVVAAAIIVAAAFVPNPRVTDTVTFTKAEA